MSVAEKILRAKDDYDAVYEVGNRSAREVIWSGYTNRTNWGTVGTFSGYGWDFDNFYPTCDIRPVGGAQQLFYNWAIKNHTGSLKQRFEECGVVLDTSQATNLTRAFASVRITEIPTIDCTALGSGSTYVFGYNNERLITIEKLIVNEAVTYDNWFYTTNLTNVEFEGAIGQNLDLSYSTRLSKASIESIIGCLSDTASGKTLMLSRKAVNNAFSETEWDALEATKTNWTITLV